MALRYVGRYATSRAKLASYLNRKLRERGWEGDQGAPVAEIVARFDELGYVNDAEYAASKARDLAARGYGERRLGNVLFAAGIEDADASEARAIGAGQRVEAALAFARRRRFGPFAIEHVDDPKQRQRQMAAMLRAGHAPGLARAILDLEPGAEIDLNMLNDA